MGEAKRRGTFEERQAAAIARDEATLKRITKGQVEFPEMPATTTEPQRRTMRNLVIAAALAIAAGVDVSGPSRRRRG